MLTRKQKDSGLEDLGEGFNEMAQLTKQDVRNLNDTLGSILKSLRMLHDRLLIVEDRLNKKPHRNGA